MNKSQIQAIAKIRKLLTSKPHKEWAIDVALSARVPDTLRFSVSDTIDAKGHVAKLIRVYDAVITGDCREIIAPLCAATDEFTFASIGLDETVFRSDPRLGYGINNQSRIGAKSAWIVDYNTAEHGRWFVLVSYGTVIGAWRVGSDTIYLSRKSRKYSTTTNRHISAFKDHVQYALDIDGKRAVFKYAQFVGVKGC